MFALKLLLFALFTNGVLSNYRNKRLSHGKYVACYYRSWAIYRNGEGFLNPIDINAEYCTNLIYAFAGLNGSDIKALDSFADLNSNSGKDGYRQLTQLRWKYPGLKVSLALGGWNQGSHNFSQLARNQRSRQEFVRNVKHFLRQYNFQGLDFDWEYPTERGGSYEDRDNFVALLRDLRQEFKNEFLLTAAISADPNSMDKRYDLRRMSEYLDYIHLMTYDYHVQINTQKNLILPNAPLDEVNKTLDHALRSGAPAYKFVIGLPLYGRTYILEYPLRSPEENPIGKMSLPTKFAGEYNDEPGVMGYDEICSKLKTNHTWIDKWDNLSSTPYARYNNTVIVYDNARSLQMKVQMAMQKGFGGVMVWSIDTDDFRGSCIPSYRRDNVHPDDYKYPLMQAITLALERGSSSADLSTSPINIFILLCVTTFVSLRYSI